MQSLTLEAGTSDFRSDQPRLLIVDDERINLRLLERLFLSDYEVVGVASGREALNALAGDCSFDAVLLDIMMPGMDGFQVLTAIRERCERSELPVILISALSDSHDIVRGLELGANDYLTKPVNPEIARARVQTQITLKRLVDERTRTISELQEMQKMRDRFFSIASHDLKAPLANIRMAQFLLRDVVKGDANTLKVLDTIDVTIDAMQLVIADFLDTAALQGGSLDLQFTEVDVPELLWEVMTPFEMLAAHKNITLDVSEAEGAVWADSHRLGQVIANLVSNAIKYSPPDSLVRVATRSDGDMLRISVVDEGPGIPADERPTLFTEFGKLSTRPTGGESSTGLGLWIVKQLTELQHGRVGADFPAGGGSIFWVELPQVADA